MAINKRKILQSAQKHLQKGALEKALKDYQTLLAADPRDANLRLKIGDIELKRGRRDQAVAAYMKVAEAFMNDGFDAKAVALYKQITKIDEKRADVLVPLADLYQRMGLHSDAMNALQTAADAHYRDGRKDDALDLLRRMAALDPSNTNSRLKVADLLRQQDRNDEAISEYEEVAEELDRQGAEEDRIRVLVRLLELAPDRVDLMASVARSRLDSGKFAAAEKTANMMIEQQPDEPDAWLLLGEACASLDKSTESADAYRRAAEIHRERGNDDVARDITQRFVPTAKLDDPDPDPGEAADDQLLGGAVEDLGGTAPDPGFDSNGLSVGSPLGEGNEDRNQAGAMSLPPLPRMEVSEPEVEHDVDGDPEQLLAEASVYIRYGKHDRAIESLRAIVRQDPSCVAAFAKLGQALEATGQTEHAITAYERGAEAAGQGGDVTAFEDLRRSLAALDSERAASLAAVAVEVEADASEPEVESDTEPAAAPDAEFEIDLEVELDASVEADDQEVSSESPSDEGQASSEAPEVEIELSLEEEDDTARAGEEPIAEFDVPEAAEKSTSALAEAELVEIEAPDAMPLEDDVLIEDIAAPTLVEISDPDLDLVFADDASSEDGADLDGEGIEKSTDPVSLQSPEEAVGASASATTPAQMAEDLEEADFFLQQGMLDEASAIYQRILEVAPGHPGALLRVGEIEAAAGGEIDAATVEVDAEPATAESSQPFDLAADEGVDPVDEDELASSGVERAAKTDLGGDPDEDTGRIQKAIDPEVAGAGDGAVELEAAESEDAEPEDAEPDDVEPEGAESVEVSAAPKVAEAEVTAPVMLDASTGEDAGFDLAAQLADAFDLEDAGGKYTPLAVGTESEGFEEVFAAFKQGVEGALDEGDFEAHYDLGIAYKEMGLFEDSISEFQAAMGAEVRRLPSLHMMGLCALELGRVNDAVAHIEQALGLPGVPEEQQLGLRFDLGRAYATIGDLARARIAFEAVQAFDPEFPDVGEQLAALDEAPESESSAVEDTSPDEEEAFENFDDFLSDGPSGLEEAQEEEPVYESFEDFMQDDEDEDDSESGSVQTEAIESESDPEDVPDPEEAPEPEPVPEQAVEPSEDPARPDPPKKPGRRKKKISFV